MATHIARNLVRRSASSAKSLLSQVQSNRSFPSGPSPLGGTAPRFRPLFSSPRLPVELGSLMPLHSVTASALLKSMLSSEVGQWSVLSEDELSSKQAP